MEGTPLKFMEFICLEPSTCSTSDMLWSIPELIATELSLFMIIVTAIIAVLVIIGLPTLPFFILTVRSEDLHEWLSWLPIEQLYLPIIVLWTAATTYVLLNYGPIGHGDVTIPDTWVLKG